MIINMRIEGTGPECARMVAEIEKMGEIRSQSRFYPNRGSAIIGRVYLQVAVSDNNENTCVCCGEIIPEGRQFCRKCECGA